MDRTGALYPLYVDLDGTYLKTDLLFESLISAIKNNPLVVFYCLLWVAKGKSFLKYKLSLAADLNTKVMPTNTEFHDFLKNEKARGRKIFLATASTEKYANQVVLESDVFDGYISSTKLRNLKGVAKLNKIIERDEDFAYAGNESVDFGIFSRAKESFLVNPDRGALKKSENENISKVFDAQHRSIGMLWVKQFRIHQWLKNLLIFVPVLVSGLFVELNSVLLSAAAFVSFSLLASSTYIVNDLLDVESDRCHPRKKNRPIAAGDISILGALIAALLLFSLSIVLALLINYQFAVVLACYLFLTLSYSFKIKQYIAMDVVMLAILYTVRIIAGTYVLGIEASFWLIAFSIFIFLSLALVKRCSEIYSLKKSGKERASGRDYTVEDYAVLESFGASSALLSVLMFVFYINNNALTNQYQKPTLLWLIVPALCYWLMRMWIKTHRGEMHDDPILYSLKDMGSIVTIGFCCFIAIVAQFL